jgi:hypothetical protein
VSTLLQSLGLPCSGSVDNYCDSSFELHLCCFGVPDALLPDSPSQFTPRYFRHMCFYSRHAAPCYPQPSQYEWFNRSLCIALIAYRYQDDARSDENLCWLQFACNSPYSDGHMHTNFGLVFSFTPNSLLSALWSINDVLLDSPDKPFYMLSMECITFKFTVSP